MGKQYDNVMRLETYEVEFLKSSPEICLKLTPDASQFCEKHGRNALSDAYSQLRALGFYPRNGLKFGCDFLLYTSKSPAESHSVYMCSLA